MELQILTTSSAEKESIKTDDMNTFKSMIIALSVCMMTGCAADVTSVEIYPIQDNPAPRKMNAALFSAPDSLISELGLEEGVPSSVCAFLVKTDDKEILFDAANGASDSRLMTVLDSLGVAASGIDYIFMTHLHGDHFGGLVKDGKAVFTEAEVYINKVEYDATMAMQGGQAERFRMIADEYGDRMRTFTLDESLPCGVKASAAYGHTAGHTVYQIDDILIAGDIMHGVALQKDHPEYCASYDMDKESAVASRKELLQMAAQENLRVYGMHFPPPYHL